jgi:hypothetical protein
MAPYAQVLGGSHEASSLLELLIDLYRLVSDRTWPSCLHILHCLTKKLLRTSQVNVPLLGLVVSRIMGSVQQPHPDWHHDRHLAQLATCQLLQVIDERWPGLLDVATFVSAVRSENSGERMRMADLLIDGLAEDRADSRLWSGDFCLRTDMTWHQAYFVNLKGRMIHIVEKSGLGFRNAASFQVRLSDGQMVYLPIESGQHLCWWMKYATV